MGSARTKSRPNMPAVSADAPAASSVLVIDDEPMIGRVVKRMYGKYGQVHVETDARVALARIASGESFDVIFCDLMMPGCNGMEFYGALATSHPETTSRVVFMTGGACNEAAESFLARVKNMQLPKPFDTAALLEITRAVVRAHAPSER